MMNAKTLELLKPFWGDRQQVASFVDGAFVDGSGERITVRTPMTTARPTATPMPTWPWSSAPIPPPAGRARNGAP